MGCRGERYGVRGKRGEVRGERRKEEEGKEKLNGLADQVSAVSKSAFSNSEVKSLQINH